jgi:type II secretory pathway component GspD/PulD (secretin)
MTGDYTVMLRAIAESGKLEVLSRPTILARNNQQATITVGQQVPLITNVRYDNFGNQINSITYQDVGIILRVTPFITSDGMVEMIVSPEISNRTGEFITISEGVDIPIIAKRGADTVVVTPDGKTVVIGGLMENNKTDNERKVPVLGDIPGLGYLFKRKTKTATKTELLIFLTPYVVGRPENLAKMTSDETGKTQLAPKAFSNTELERYLDGLPLKSTPPAESDGKKKKAK